MFPVISPKIKWDPATIKYCIKNSSNYDSNWKDRTVKSTMEKAY